MIQDKTIDEALIELMRCKKALEALRSERKAEASDLDAPKRYWVRPSKNHAAAKRASIDLTRKLAQLRAGK